MELVILLFVVLVGWLVLSAFRGSAVRRVAEQTEVNERDRLAHLLVSEIKRWESEDPEHVGIPQCLERGTRWVLERAVGVAPALANLIAKSAYRQILKEKIEECVGPMATADFAREMTEEARRLEKMSRKQEGVDKWWDDVDYQYDTLYEKARDCGALTKEFALKFYGREPQAKPKSRVARATGDLTPPAQPSPPPEPAKPTEVASLSVASVSCASCGAGNDPDAAFCKRCGKRLDGRRGCAKCETINDADAAFCKKCGSSVAAGVPG